MDLNAKIMTQGRTDTAKRAQASIRLLAPALMQQLLILRQVANHYSNYVHIHTHDQRETQERDADALRSVVTVLGRVTDIRLFDDPEHAENKEMQERHRNRIRRSGRAGAL